MLKKDFEALRMGELVSIRDTTGRYRVARVASVRHHDSLYTGQLARYFEYTDTGKRVYKRMRQVRSKLPGHVAAQWDMGNEWLQVKSDNTGWF